MFSTRFLRLPRLVAGILLSGILLHSGFAQPAVRQNAPRPARAAAERTPNIDRVAGTSNNDWLSAPHLMMGEGMSLGFLLNLGARHNDNIFLTEAEEEADTILTVTPRLEFRYGRNARMHGTVGFEENFTRYAGGSAPSANLAAANASLAYDGAATSVSTSFAFRQNYQNSRDLAFLGQKQVYRSDSLNIHASAETMLTVKTSVSAAADFSRVEYKTPGLIGTQDLTLPLKLYYHLTPKVSLSAGFSYRKVDPPGGNTDGRDTDWNLGARGNFNPKLSGQVSAGYRTRKIGNKPDESIFIFNGNLDYEISPKTAASLVLSRDFGTAAQGASLQTASYAINLTSSPTEQWQFGSGLAYRRVAYGPVVFTTNPTPPVTGQKDDYWEANLFTRYQPTTSISTALSYTVSSNHSTLLPAEYTSNVVNLTVGWMY